MPPSGDVPNSAQARRQSPDPWSGPEQEPGPHGARSQFYPTPEFRERQVNQELSGKTGSQKIRMEKRWNKSEGVQEPDRGAFRPPEPYNGKGVKYSDERMFRKEGKGPSKIK
jgi:hypothetical protein